MANNRKQPLKPAVVPRPAVPVQMVISDGLIVAPIGMVVDLPLAMLRPNPDQPRRYFNIEKMRALEESIKEVGMKQPILVNVREGGKWAMIIDGERRYRACKKIGKDAIPSLICSDAEAKRLAKAARDSEMSKSDIFLDSAIANLGREDMSLIEKARGIEQLMEERGWPQIKVASVLCMTQVTVSNTLKVLKLHPDIQGLLLVEKIDKGIALQLASYDEDRQLVLLAKLKKESEALSAVGRRLHPNDAARILRGEAERSGFRPSARSKKGRDHYSYAQLTVNKVVRDCVKLEASLKELGSLTPDQLAELKEPTPYSLLTVIQDTRNKLGDTIKKVSVVV